MGWRGSSRHGAATWLSSLAILVSCTLTVATTSCGFTESEGFCGWTANVPGSTWQIGSIGGQPPPDGSTSYAYVVSGQEAWAELESESLKLTTATTLSFAILQTRIDVFSTDDYVKLLHVADDGSSSSVIWSTKNSLDWEYGSVFLKPELGTFRLRFMFRVGNERNRAALGKLLLENEVAGGFSTAALTPITTQRELPTRLQVTDETTTEEETAQSTIATQTTPQIDTETSLSCTFATSTCAWTDSESSFFMWEITEATGTGSGADPPGPAPTTDELDDHVRYLFVSGNDLEDGSLYAALESPFFTFTGPSTLSFWHRKSSKEASVLGIVVYNEVYAPSNNSHIEIAVPNGQWTKKTIDLDTRNTVQITFSAILMEANESAALDEIRWSGDTAGPPVIVIPTEPPTIPFPLPVITSVTCDFDSPVIPQCRWNSDPIGIEWSHSNGSLVGDEVVGVSGPSPFLYADSTDASPERLSARLISPMVSHSGGVKTQLIFSYRLYGSGVTDLEVALESNGLVKSIFRAANQSREWVQGSVDICMERDFQVVFEVDFTMAGFVAAIDDIILVNETAYAVAVPPAGSCDDSGWSVKTTPAPPPPTSSSVVTTPALATTMAPDTTVAAATTSAPLTNITQSPIVQPAIDPLTCNFDSDICEGWAGGADDDFHWMWSASNSSANGSSSPPVAPSGAGFLQATLFSESFDPKRATMYSDVFYAVRGERSVVRLSFWLCTETHDRDGGAENLFTVETVAKGTGGSTERLRTFSSTEDDTLWQKIEIEFCTVAAVLLKFQAHSVGRQIFTVRLDEVMTTRSNNDSVGCPSVGLLYIPEATCDFDTGSLCPGWISGLTTTSGKTVSWKVTNTTDSSGEFLEGAGVGMLSAAPLPSETAIVTTGNVDLPQDAEQSYSTGHIQFWLMAKQLNNNNSNATSGRATLRVVFLSRGSSLVVLEFDASSVFTPWIIVEKDFCIPSPGLLSFEFSVPSGDFAYVANVDEIITIRLTGPEADNHSSELCPKQVTTLSCDFESSARPTCGWTSDPTGLAFSTSSQAVGGPQYGISGSATNGSLFAYVDSKDISHGRWTARLVSPLTGLGSASWSSPTQLTFWYRAFGPGIEQLQVHVEGAAGPEKMQIIWSNTSRSPNWSQATVFFCAESYFKVVFEVKFLLPGYILGLDDVVFTPAVDEKCSQYPAFPITTPSPLETFTEVTTSVTTIPTEITIATAPPDTTINGSLSCNFEDDKCGWHIISQFSIGRSLLNNESDPNNALFATANNSMSAKTISRVIIGMPGAPQQLQFDYASYGRGARSLSVHLVVGNHINSTAVWTFDSFLQKRLWTVGIASFVVPSDAYRILFEAKFSDRNSVIAIDNIIFEGEDGSTVGSTQPSVSSARPVLVPIVNEATCQFDQGLCPSWRAISGWTTYPAENMDDALPHQGPHSGTGYAYKYGKGTSAALKTGVVNHIPALRVTFWANVFSHQLGLMDESGKFILRVVSRGAGSDRQMGVYIAETNYTDQWKYYEVDFCHGGSYKLSFEFEAPQATIQMDRINIALDEVVSSRPEGVCTGAVVIAGVTAYSEQLIEEASCTFENTDLDVNKGLCNGWGTFGFEVINSSTLHAIEGQGIAVLQADGGSFGANAMLMSRAFNGDQSDGIQSVMSGHVTFWLNQLTLSNQTTESSDFEFSLSLAGRNEGGDRDILRTWKSAVPRQWTWYSLEFCLVGQAHLAFEFVGADGFFRGIAIDDVITYQANDTCDETTVSDGFEDLSIYDATCSFDTLYSCDGWSLAEESPSQCFWTSTQISGDDNFLNSANGTGYLEAVLVGSCAATLKTPKITVPRTTESASVSFWLKISDPTGSSSALSPYQFRMISVSAVDSDDDELLVISSITVPVEWQKYTAEVCLVNISHITFVVENSQNDLFFALDEIVSKKTEGSAICQAATPATTNTPAPTSPSQPTCLTWEAVDDASCDFDLGICGGWIFPDGNLLFFQASRPTGIAPYIVPGPQQGDGYAVTACSVYAGLPDSGTSALRSPPIRVSQSEIFYGRVSFWYVFANVDGDNRTRHLRLDMRTRENRTTLWTATDQPSTFWRYAQVTFISQVDVELEFAAEHVDCSVPTALDSIVTERGNASEPCDITRETVSCDFENGHLCAWGFANGLKGWKHGLGKVGSGQYGLNGTDFGEGFMYVDSSTLAYPSEPAEIGTRYQPAVKSQLTFYYRTYGWGVASFNLFLNNKANRFLIWSASSLLNSWVPMSIEICSTEQYQLVFEARFSGTGFIAALDNIVLASENLTTTAEQTPINCSLPDAYTTVTLPVTQSTVPIRQSTVTTTPTPSAATVILPEPWNGTIYCDFEAGTLCDWRNVNTSSGQDLEWVATTNKTVLPIAGAYYALVQFTQNSSFLARLLSPVIDIPSDRNRTVTLRFYYRTSGRGSSGITIYTVDSGLLPTTGPIWSSGVGALDRWNMARVTLQFPEVSRRQLILQTRFIRRDSWTAIDDIGLVSIVEEGTCGFEAGLCAGWSNIPGRYNWRPQFGGIVAPQDGAGYVLVNSMVDPREYRQPAELRSAPLLTSYPKMSTSITVQFWYYLGSAQATLQLRQVSAGLNSWLTELEITNSSVNGTVGVWTKADVTFCLLSKVYDGLLHAVHDVRLAFRVVPGLDFSFVGLDEIVTHSNDGFEAICARPVTPTFPPDLPTENRSLSCHFDDDFCGWTSHTFTIQADGNETKSGIAYVSTAEYDGVGSMLEAGRYIYLTKRTQLTFEYNAFASRDLVRVEVSASGWNSNGDAFTQTLWSLTGGEQVPSFTWLPARVSLCVTGHFKLKITVSLIPHSEGRFGLKKVVIKDEAATIINKPSNFTCNPLPQSVTANAISCSPDNTSTTFCGWASTATDLVKANVTVGKITGIVGQGLEDANYLYVQPDPTNSPEESAAAVIRSSPIQRTSRNTGEVSMWYLLHGGTAQFRSSDSAEALNLTDNGRIWTPVVYHIPAVSLVNRAAEQSFTLDISVQFPVSALPVPSSLVPTDIQFSTASSSATSVPYFAMDSVWYTAEPGYLPIDEDPDPTIAPLSSAEPVTNSTTNTTEPVTPTSPTEPASTPPTEPASTPPTEPASTPPTEPASTPPTEPASTPPTEPVSTPPTEPASTPPTEPASTPPTEPASTPPTEPVSTPPTEPASTPPTQPTPITTLPTSAPTDVITVNTTLSTEPVSITVGTLEPTATTVSTVTVPSLNTTSSTVAPPTGLTKSQKIAIALGTAAGVITLIAVILIARYCYKKQQRNEEADEEHARQREIIEMIHTTSPAPFAADGGGSVGPLPKKGTLETKGSIKYLSRDFDT